jgi:hypothetical protein
MSFPSNRETFDAFWLPPRTKEHGNIVRFVVRYALVLSALALGTMVWTTFNQAVQPGGQPRAINKLVASLAFVVPLIVAMIVAATASTF